MERNLYYTGQNDIEVCGQLQKAGFDAMNVDGKIMVVRVTGTRLFQGWVEPDTWVYKNGKFMVQAE